VAACTPRVLVVDNHADVADLFREILALKGYIVRCAYDGSEALALAREFHPDTVFLNLALPDVDGFAVAAALREDPVPPHLVALSSLDDEATRARSKAAGFAVHLRKPSSIDAIVEAVAGAHA
jgi:CheY-like chemotaxis protein